MWRKKAFNFMHIYQCRTHVLSRARARLVVGGSRVSLFVLAFNLYRVMQIWVLERPKMKVESNFTANTGIFTYR
jgi:hypothetical protein